MANGVLLEKVKVLIHDLLNINLSQIQGESHFVDDLKFDSLDTVEFIMKCEDVFELEMPDEEAEKIKTVLQAVEYLDSKINGDFVPEVKVSENCGKCPADKLCKYVGVGHKGSDCIAFFTKLRGYRY